jgi:hypothetical protein
LATCHAFSRRFRSAGILPAFFLRLASRRYRGRPKASNPRLRNQSTHHRANSPLHFPLAIYFARRNRGLVHSLELIMEKADRFEPTADDIITAVDKYRKFDPDTFEKTRTPRPKQIVIREETALEAYLQSNPSMRKLVRDTASMISSVKPPISNLQPLISNRHTSKLKSSVTRSKQTPRAQSNRHKLRGGHSAISRGSKGVRPI